MLKVGRKRLRKFRSLFDTNRLLLIQVSLTSYYGHKTTDAAETTAMNRLACNTCRRLLTASLLQPGRSFTTISTSSIPSKSKSKSKRRKVSVDQWPGWNTVIGLELHVQLKGNVKLLSRSSSLFPISRSTPFYSSNPAA